jgi:hypothetical protein
MSNFTSTAARGYILTLYINLFLGSVNGGNSSELAKKEDIDGFLVGGASLKVYGFFIISLTKLTKPLSLTSLCC